MKKLFLISLLFPALAFAAPVSNTVTVNALVFATTPLAGTERVPLYQSGLKSATVAQINADPVAYTTAVSNLTQSALVKWTNSNVGLNTTSNKLENFTNAFAAWSNSVAANIAGQGALAKSNGVAFAQVAGLGSIAGRGSNDFYLASNPSGYQTAGQVTTTVNSAIAVATLGAATNGGGASFKSVLTPSTNAGTFTTLSAGNDTTNIVIDLAAGSYQIVNVTPRSGGNSTFNFTYTNATDGQNVYVLLNPTAAIQYKYQFQNGVDSWASTAPPYTVSSTAKFALLNFQVIGSTVIATRGTHP